MNSRLQPISVSFERIEPLLEQARAADLDIDELFKSLDLSPAEINASVRDTISLADYYRIQNRLSILFGDETVHLSSRQLLQGSTDFVLQHVSDSKNLFETMQVIARSYNLLHGGEYNSVSKHRGLIEYVIDDRAFPYVANQPAEYLYFSTECILIFLHCMLMIVNT